MIETEQDWERRYAEGKTGWDRGQPSPVLQAWMPAIREAGQRVLIPGCGRGYEVVELARQGLDVTGLDMAPAAIRDANANLQAAGVKATIVQTDLFHWQPPEPMDVVYEQTCLCALSPLQWKDYQQQLYDWLRPGGLLLALFMQTHSEGGPPYHCDVQQMRELFAVDRWRWLDDDFLPVEHPSGRHELGMKLQRL